MDHTKELAEIALQFIDIVVHHKVMAHDDQNILTNEPVMIDNVLKRYIPSKVAKYNISTLIKSITKVLKDIY